MPFEDYEQEEFLGSGGFGDVYRAQDARHDRTVALKVYRFFLSPAAETEFNRECRASGRVSRHASIVTILDSGITKDNRGYLVFEYIDGGNLTDYIAAHGPLEPALALEWAIQLADALAFAHKHNIWHRDIKPDNVLLDNDRALLADFGIAKLIDGTATSTGGGYTPVFAAPERVIDEQQGPQCDLYSFGVTLWHMCSGELPHGLNTTTPAVKAALRARELPAPTLDDPSLPQPLRQLITDLLQPDPTNRITTAAELLTRLRECSDWIEEQARDAERAQREVERQQAEASQCEAAKATERAMNAEANAEQARQELDSMRLSRLPEQFEANEAAKEPKQASRRSATSGNAIPSPPMPPTVQATPGGDTQSPSPHELLADSVPGDEPEATDSADQGVSPGQPPRSRMSRFRLPAAILLVILVAAAVSAAIFSRDTTKESSSSSESQPAAEFAADPKLLQFGDKGDNAGQLFTGQIEWSLDGTKIASAVQSTKALALAYDAHTGRQIASLGKAPESIAELSAVAWSPNGELLAGGNLDLDRRITVSIWNTSSGKEAQTLPDNVTGPAYEMDWSPDGKQLAVGGNDDVRIWDPVTAKEVRVLRTGVGSFPPVAWSPDGTRIATGDSDTVAKVWDAQSGKAVATFGRENGGGTSSIEWSPDGKRIATASGSGVKVWDAQTHEEIHTLNREKATSYVTWSPDGKNLASVGGLGVIWNATTGQKVREFETDYAGGPVAWSPIERRIATIYKDQLSTWSWES
ncbi:MAG: protein kinase [Candidatus Nanopelagicales bacterium]